MKAQRSTALGAAILFARSSAAHAQPLPAVRPHGKPEPLNPWRIATLRWYESNEAQNRFAVGSFAFAAACDGDHVWVSSTGDQTLTKFRASDGAKLGTFSVPGFPRISRTTARTFGPRTATTRCRRCARRTAPRWPC